MKAYAHILALLMISTTSATIIHTSEDHALTQQRIRALSSALQEYWDTYQQLPLTFTKDKLKASVEVVEILIGKNYHGQNPKLISFISDKSFTINNDTKPLRYPEGPVLDAWTNSILIMLDYKTNRAEIRSPGQNSEMDEDIKDDLLEIIQFEK